MEINDFVKYVGVNDHQIDLFEGQYVVKNGMSYNSYVILDEKIVIMDSVDTSFSDEWFKNLDAVLENRKPDYLIIQHMEPDHSGSLLKFMARYPETTLVGNVRTFKYFKNFFHMEPSNVLVVNDGDTLNIGKRTLKFVFAPMVHWPEVMFTYDDIDKALFTADGFGKFGALDVEEDWLDEARRYYIGIVGKFGKNVQAALKKISSLDIKYICALHGPVLKDNLSYYIEKYDTWSSYRPEVEGVAIFFTSVYGNTKEAAYKLYEGLKARGVDTVIYDLARSDMSLCVAEAFKYSKIVLATTTYNGTIYPFMNNFIDALVEREYQNRKIALIENGTFVPTASKTMMEKFAKSLNIEFVEPQVKIWANADEVALGQLKELEEALSK